MHDPRSPSATDPPVPAEVGDILLWRLAVEVAAAHQPGPDGRCRSPLCTGQQTYPCPPAAAAQRAEQAAYRATPTARGRAAVPARAAAARALPPPSAVTGRAPLIGAARAAAQPPSAAPYRGDLWPPPLRRPSAGHAA